MMPPVEFIGIPYLDRGETIDGCDCWGLVRLFHERVLGRRLPHYDYRSANGPEVPDLLRQGWVRWQPVELPQTQLGDVLALKIGRNPVHCGIVINSRQMLHILEGRNSCIEEYASGFWFNCIARIGRWKS
jgi:murein DD-endopeptidase / murein LD-carboxypeptidase